MAIILTTGIAFGSPLPSGVLIADHTSDQDAALLGEAAQPDSQTAPLSQPTRSPQAETHSAPADPNGDRGPQLNKPQPTQASPSVPYDPYDYNVIRQLNREIYGEAKAKQE